MTHDEKPILSAWKKVIQIFTEPTCCDVTDQDCRQGRDCPVRNGSHKPADAIQHIQEPEA